MTILQLDGDMFVFRSAASCQPTRAKPYLEDEATALHRLEGMLLDIHERFTPEKINIFLGGPTNYRKQVYPEYKANRTAEKPIHLAACREYITTFHGAVVCDGIEADDAMGIEQAKHGLSSIICSNDKDMKTVPGRHYNPVTKEEFQMSPVQSLRYFYSQVILGDGADNIPGFDGKLRGQMPMFIQKLCAPLEEMTEEIDMYHYVKDIYSDTSTWEVDGKAICHRNCQLLYILREPNVFWAPPKQA